MPKLKDLQIGDVILTLAGQKPPALHTQIFTGGSLVDFTTIHAVDDLNRGWHKVMATGLQGSEDYLVMRCKTGALARDAAELAVHWAKYETPYDEERRHNREAYRNYLAVTVGESRLLATLKKVFEDKGKFRAIKYASRRDDILCYPKEDGSPGRGVNCAMFVVLCYQAAGLKGQVLKPTEILPGQGMVRVADKKLDPAEVEILKKMPPELVNPQDREQYLAYLDGVKSDNEFQINWDLAGRNPFKKGPPGKRWLGYHYLPSILCWRDPKTMPVHRFDFAKAFTAGMMLDAKVVTSDQLRLALLDDKGGWENLGYLEKETGPHDPKYKDKLSTHAKDSVVQRKKFGQQKPPTFDLGPINLKPN